MGDPRVREMAIRAKAWAKKVYAPLTPGPRLLVLVGPTGTGKTHVMNALRKWADHICFDVFEKRIWGKPLDRFYALWPEMADTFKTGEFGSVANMMQSDLLFLDDVGAEHDPTQLATGKFYQILSKREGKFTVITTNVEVSGWVKRWDVRIRDRLFRGSVIVDLTGVKSYSLQKGLL